jgi:hypothetical protein
LSDGNLPRALHLLVVSASLRRESLSFRLAELAAVTIKATGGQVDHSSIRVRQVSR